MTTMRKGTVAALILAAMTLAAGTVNAQDRSFGFRGWGPRVGLSVDPGGLVVGAHLDMGEITPHIRFQPNAEVGFHDDFTSLALNAPLHYRFTDPIEHWSPYVGAELGWVFAFSSGDDSSDLGFSAVGGFEKQIGNGNKFFAEAKLGLSDQVPDWKFLAGWTFLK